MSAVPRYPPEASLSFRTLSEDDLERVAAIERVAYVFPWTMGNFRDSLQSGYFCWGAFAEKHLVAYAIVMKALDEAHLLNLAVAPPRQHRGIGASLLRFVLSAVAKQGCKRCLLEVRPSNLVGRQLYERFGFKLVGTRRGYYPAVTGREDALVLVLDLDRPQ